MYVLYEKNFAIFSKPNPTWICRCNGFVPYCHSSIVFFHWHCVLSSVVWKYVVLWIVCFVMGVDCVYVCVYSGMIVVYLSWVDIVWRLLLLLCSAIYQLIMYFGKWNIFINVYELFWLYFAYCQYNLLLKTTTWFITMWF